MLVTQIGAVIALNGFAYEASLPLSLFIAAVLVVFGAVIPRTLAGLLSEQWVPHREDEGAAVKINLLLRRLPRLKAEGIDSAEAFAGSFHIDEGYRQMQESWSRARSATPSTSWASPSGWCCCTSRVRPRW